MQSRNYFIDKSAQEPEQQKSPSIINLRKLSLLDWKAEHNDNNCYTHIYIYLFSETFQNMQFLLNVPIWICYTEIQQNKRSKQLNIISNCNSSSDRNNNKTQEWNYIQAAR